MDMYNIVDCLKEQIVQEVKKDILKMLIKAYIKDLIETADENTGGAIKTIIIKRTQGVMNG